MAAVDFFSFNMCSWFTGKYGHQHVHDGGGNNIAKDT
jgi:hypothetical protein